ncbi:MAG: hypothetical protein U0R80_09095 [Nocardioidaceae bacterium]
MAARARNGSARLVAVLACLLLPLALLSVWVAGVVTSTDQYVRTVGPVASDPVVQQAVEKRLESLAVAALDARIAQLDAAVAAGRLGRVGGWVRNHRGELGNGARTAVVDAVGTAVAAVVESDEFQPAWEAANRSAHEQLLDAIQGDSTLVDTTDGVSVELGTLLNAVFGILVDEGLLPSARVPDIQATFPVLTAHQLDQARQVYRLVHALGLWLPLVVGALVVLALLLARSRRPVLVWLGLGSLLGGLLVVVALALARPRVLDQVAGTYEDRVLLGAVWDVVVGSLRTAGLVAAAVGLVVALVAVVARRRAPAAGHA